MQDYWSGRGVPLDLKLGRCFDLVYFKRLSSPNSLGRFSSNLKFSQFLNGSGVIIGLWCWSLIRDTTSYLVHCSRARNTWSDWFDLKYRILSCTFAKSTFHCFGVMYPLLFYSFDLQPHLLGSWFESQSLAYLWHEFTNQFIWDWTAGNYSMC